MDISVIIPTYRPQEYLWDCLNSMCTQTLERSRFEVIIILNGCGEPYNSKIKEFIAQHPDVEWVYIQTDTPGVSNARNMALDVAKGNNITFLDDDDYLSSVCLEEMLKLQDGNVVVECYPYAFEDGNPETQRDYGLTKVYDYCLQHKCYVLNSHARKFFSGPCMKLIPASYIQDRRFDVRFKNGEDCLFMFSISDKIHNIVYTSKNAIYYRRFRNNSATKNKRASSEIIQNTIKCMIEYTKMFKFGRYSIYFYSSRMVAEALCIIKVFVCK